MPLPANAKAANTFQRPGIPVSLPDGTTAYAELVATADASGNIANSTSYNLTGSATPVGLAATTGTTPIAGVVGGVYVWDAQFTGTSLQLQSLGADGTTYRTVATLNAAGTFAGEVRVGRNATLRLYNPNGTALTAVSSSLS